MYICTVVYSGIVYTYVVYTPRVYVHIVYATDMYVQLCSSTFMQGIQLGSCTYVGVCMFVYNMCTLFTCEGLCVPVSVHT